jgi:ubiquinone/menaquinone biosynthesis C-methylase UbiE
MLKKNIVDDNTQFESITCPLCSCDKCETVYQCFQETGDTLGRILTSFVVCNSCGFMYQNPRPRFELLMKHYSENEAASGSVYHDIQKGSYHDEKQKSRRRFYSKHLKKISKGSLLEVGCSTGDYLLSLKLSDWHLTGLEPSVKAADQANAHGLEVICSSLEDSNLDDKTYDVVSCFSVLEHLHDINSAMQIMSRILKDGGLLCLEVPDTMKPTPQISEFFTFEHMSHFIKETLIFFLKGYGYSDFEFDGNVQDARLRLCARKTSDALIANTNKVAEDLTELNVARNLLIEQVENYKNGKNALEKNILDRLSSYILRWKKQGKSIAIYGAGFHTRYLMNLFDLSDNVTAILDSDPAEQGKNFLRWTIYGEELLASGKINAVIISSKVFEDEIYKRIEKYSIDSDIEIIRCYND